MAKSRNYRKEYDNYQGRPEQVKRRSMRNYARAQYEKTYGDLPSGVDVDHVKPLAKGGSNDLSNTRARPRSANRSFRRTRSARMK